MRNGPSAAANMTGAEEAKLLKIDEGKVDNDVVVSYTKAG